MEIRIHSLSNLSDKQQVKIKEALKGGEPVLDSVIWEAKVLRAVFTETRGYTNKQIVDMVRSGAHDGGRADQVIDINIIGFYKLNNVVGYTYLGSLKQWINRKFLDRYSHADIFHHVMHETMHRCHRFVHTKVHATSVPYKVGYLSAEAYKEFYKRGIQATNLTSNTRFTFTE